LAKHFGFAVNGRVEDRREGKQKEETNGEAKEENVAVLQQLALAGKAVGVDPETALYDICPECGGGSFVYEEGCKKCYSCGYSEC